MDLKFPKGISNRAGFRVGLQSVFLVQTLVTLCINSSDVHNTRVSQQQAQSNICCTLVLCSPPIALGLVTGIIRTRFPRENGNPAQHMDVTWERAIQHRNAQIEDYPHLKQWPGAVLTHKSISIMSRNHELGDTMTRFMMNCRLADFPFSIDSYTKFTLSYLTRICSENVPYQVLEPV